LHHDSQDEGRIKIHIFRTDERKGGKKVEKENKKEKEKEKD
jgi:hypothetical protein